MARYCGSAICRRMFSREYRRLASRRHADEQNWTVCLDVVNALPHSLHCALTVLPIDRSALPLHRLQ